MPARRISSSWRRGRVLLLFVPAFLVTTGLVLSNSGPTAPQSQGDRATQAPPRPSEEVREAVATRGAHLHYQGPLFRFCRYRGRSYP